MSLTDRIIEKEFSMFTTVNQGHDRADCQDDKETFTIMRKSQFSAYDILTLESYLQDLLAAEAGHRNLVTEKYAWMMAKTAPADAPCTGKKHGSGHYAGHSAGVWLCLTHRCGTKIVCYPRILRIHSPFPVHFNVIYVFLSLMFANFLKIL